VLDLEGDLPHFIFADSVRLKQIIVNLIGNALKFTMEGSTNVMEIA
jgi:signal transduction histidine kinase